MESQTAVPAAPTVDLRAVRSTEYIGSAAGVIGAVVMALMPQMGITAYTAWLLSSTLLTGYGLITRAYGIALMSAVYTVINVVGLVTRL